MPGQSFSDLRIVPASELHADTIAEENAANQPSSEDKINLGGDGVEFQLVSSTGEIVMRSNRETIDDSARQTLTMEEIESLKREGTGAGKDLIAKLMASHLGIEQKTAFSLAKYKLLKTKKYLKRFTILPVDVGMLTHWMMEEKDKSKIMEMREECVALMGSWSNAHFSESLPNIEDGGGRWLVVDETGGLLVAALAERMGTLYADATPDQGNGEKTHLHEEPALAASNTVTLIHNNAQPNLSLLKYFSYDASLPPLPSHLAHPLQSHLHTLSWLQLVSPESDTTLSTPLPDLTAEEISSMKANKRGTYHRKQRRLARLQSILSATQAGGFSGLAIASHMDPATILTHLVPLLRGGAPIAIFSPTIEPLVLLSDIYSTSRRTAFITAPPESFSELEVKDRDGWKGDEDFPLNPTLVINTSVQTARVRQWQVLPGRTHPVMTGAGGGEGYIFTGVRVIPAAGKIEARGKFGRKRAVETGSEVGGNGEGNEQHGKVEQNGAVGGSTRLAVEGLPNKKVRVENFTEENESMS